MISFKVYSFVSTYKAILKSEPLFTETCKVCYGSSDKREVRVKLSQVLKTQLCSFRFLGFCA